MLVKKEAKNLGVLFIIILAIFLILFRNENFMTTLRTVTSLFWLFVIPGYFLMDYWREKLAFTERLIIGTALSMALVGILGYNLGLLGLHMKYHMLFPAVFMVVGYYAGKRQEKNH